MDPFITKFKYVSSFEKNHQEVTEELDVNRYINNDIVVLTPDIQYNALFKYQDEPYVYVDQSLFANKNTKNHPMNYFINQQVTILANIDAVYNLLNVNYANFLKRNNQYNFVYLVAQDNEGNFVRYIQYRKTNAYGAGITNNNNWNYEYINTVLFEPYDGYDLSGNLIVNYDSFIQDTVETIEEKYDLVICNDFIDGNDERKMEMFYVNKLIIQCLVGLSCCSGGNNNGGHFVVHCYDLYSKINAQIVYLLSLCFDTISIIKPFTSDVTTSDKFIVCQYRKDDIEPYIKLLQNAIDNIEQDEYVSNLFSNSLPNDFIAYLTEQNNDILIYQSQSYDDYIFDNAMMYLNLPDNYVPIPINVII